jgi:hypothetical protein
MHLRCVPRRDRESRIQHSRDVLIEKAKDILRTSGAVGLAIPRIALIRQTEPCAGTQEGSIGRIRRLPTRKAMVIYHKLGRLLVLMALVGVLVWAPLFRRESCELAFVLQIAFYALATLTASRAKIGFLSNL